MDRHPLDHANPDDSAERARAFVEIERDKLPRKSTRAAQQQKRDEKPEPVAEVMRIRRGNTA